MELFALMGVAIVGSGIVATIVATWINMARSIDTDRRVAKLDTKRYELELRICELEEWRNS